MIRVCCSIDEHLSGQEDHKEVSVCSRGQRHINLRITTKENRDVSSDKIPHQLERTRLLLTSKVMQASLRVHISKQGDEQYVL